MLESQITPKNTKQETDSNARFATDMDTLLHRKRRGLKWLLLQLVRAGGSSRDFVKIGSRDVKLV